MARKSFSVHTDYYEEIKNLDAPRRGDLLLALINWAAESELPPLDPESAILFRLMTAQIERISAVNAANGARGGRGNKNEETHKSEGKRKKPTVTVSVTAADTVTDNQISSGGNIITPVSNTGARAGAGESVPFAPDLTGEGEFPGNPSIPCENAERENNGNLRCKSDFDDFWRAYPKKVGKEAAQKVWLRLRPRSDLCRKIFAAIERARRSDQWRREQGRYIPNPATWLHQRRWDDEWTAKEGGNDERDITSKEYFRDGHISDGDWNSFYGQ